MLFIKELTLKSTDAKDLANTDRLIKEALKKKKIKDIEADQRQEVAQDPLITGKDKKLSFERLVIRPSIQTKKTTGTVEVYPNGIRFHAAKSGGKVDISFKNIKHAFFQPCEDDLIVLLHFRLHQPVQVGTKKSIDVQFY